MDFMEQVDQVLFELGVPEEEYEQIKHAMDPEITTYEINDEGIFIDRDEVIQLLGLTYYVDGIVRSAFHWDCVRSTSKGTHIRFDSSALFKD